MINVLGPRIMSSAIGLHPIYVVAALLIGGQIAGIWGALFGVPIAGALNLIGRPLLRRIRSQTSLYAEPTSHDLPTSAFVTGPLAASMAASTHLDLNDLPRADAEPARPPTVDLTASVPSVPSPTPTPPRTGEKPPALLMSPAEYFAELEQDAEDNVRLSPTLSARALSLVIMMGSHATRWAWSKVRKNGKTRA